MSVAKTEGNVLVKGEDINSILENFMNININIQKRVNQLEDAISGLYDIVDKYVKNVGERMGRRVTENERNVILKSGKSESNNGFKGNIIDTNVSVEMENNEENDEGNDDVVERKLCIKVNVENEVSNDLLSISKIIESKSQIELIHKAILNSSVFQSKAINFNYQLLYRLSENDRKNSTFHQKCDNVNNTITIVKTKKNKRFGGFTSLLWNSDSDKYLDDKAFVFSLDNMKYYPVIKGKQAIYTKSICPLFYSRTNNMICIYCGYRKGSTGTVEDSFFDGIDRDYELNDGEKEFLIEEIEVYRVFLK